MKLSKNSAVITQALILAGGMGTRLRPVVKETPKPMAVINDRPFLEYLIMQTAAFGVKEIIISIGYLGEKIKAFFGNGQRYGVRILYSEETKPLGTAGAIKYAEHFITSANFLVMNGDSFLDFSLEELLSLHLSKGALATLALVHVPDASRYGSVVLGQDLQVLAFKEKGEKGQGMINGGVYVFNRHIFAFLPKGSCSLEHDVLPNLAGRGLFGLPVNAYFVDIGTPESFTALQNDPTPLLASLQRRLSPPVSPK